MPVFEEFDINSIINGTDEKIIRNKYNELKKNYSEESAKQFLDVYKDKPISFIIENSRYIFSEPYYGLKFYEERVLNPGYCNFDRIEKERDKVQEYVENYESNMSKSQKELYTTLLENFDKFIDDHKHAIAIAETISDITDDHKNIIRNISDAIYTYDPEAFMEASWIDDSGYDYDMIIEAFLPYIATLGNREFVYDITHQFVKESVNAVSVDIDNKDDLAGNTKFKKLCSKIISGNKAILDEAYHESARFIQKDIRDIVLEYVNGSVRNLLTFVHTSSDRRINHSNTKNAVNSLFDDITFDNIYKESYEEEKLRLEEYDEIASDLSMLFLEHDYGKSYDQKAYTMFPNDVEYTYEEAIQHIGEPVSFFEKQRI